MTLLRNMINENIHGLVHDKLGLIILTANGLQQAVNDTAHSFKQESHFLYLTGVDEPDWWFIFDITANKKWLVAPNMNQTHKMFDGSLAWDDARRLSGIHLVLTRAEAKKLFAELAVKHKKVFTLGADIREKDYNFTINPSSKKLRIILNKAFFTVADCRQYLERARAIKQPDEIIELKKASALTIRAFKNVKNNLDDFKYEYEVEAELTYQFRRNGAQSHAYDPIVASGKNALTLHYIKNNDPLPKNGLVLIDAGARVNGYCADVTRTYAIGTPTKRQVDVHAAVEKAHHAIVALLGPEKSVKEYHEQVDVIMIEALKSLGLYKKPEDYRRYFPHAISHGLGIDVHDPLGKPTHFKPGMMLTVEPGIYIPEEGIGVRIEDDILITETGHENLTAALSTSL